MLGIFDSGSGGLSVLKEIRAASPSMDVVYFGDIKNAPYGEKTHKELSKLTASAIHFLVKHGATNIVSACNSVSASVALSMLDILGVSAVSFLEMVGPTVSALRERVRDKCVLLVATPATIDAGIYQDSFGLIGTEIKTLALPRLAGLIERGVSDEKMRTVLADAFSVPVNADVCVLGCTHYPFITHLFEDVLPNVELYNPACAVAARVKERFSESGSGATTFYISADSGVFRNRVRELFGEGTTVIVV